jgi:CNT family concentrative nucleoside transporter
MKKSTRRWPRLALWALTVLFLAAGVADARAVGTQQGATVQDTVVVQNTATQGELTEVPAPAGRAPTSFRETRNQIETPWTSRAVAACGLGVMVGIAWLLSADRKRIPWRIVAWGTGLQFVFALFILRTPIGAAIFDGVNTVIVDLLNFTRQGASFLFGNLVDATVPVLPADGSVGAPGMVAHTGALFAFSVLPTIIFFSSLMTVLYHLGVMQKVVKGMAWVMMRTMRTSGAETLSAAGNIFLGQTEAPLLVKPFLAKMTNSEIMTVMVGGFATAAGGVMAAYVGMLVGYFPDIGGHLLAGSVMAAPAALLIAKVLYPEDGEPTTRNSMKIELASPDANVIDAAARGAGEGLTLALNVGAMLLAFVALIAVLNSLFGWASNAIHLTALLQGWGLLEAGQPLTIEVLLGWLLAPLAWVMGIPWKDAPAIGSLLGVKTVLNEFVAFTQLSGLVNGGANLAPRSVIIATYALCGFANFSSIAIQIGGIGGIAPARRSDLARLGLKAMIGGTLAAFMTAAVAGILL